MERETTMRFLTKEIGKILVPIDGSHCADTALDQAMVVAKAFQSNLTVLTVVDLYAETTPLRLEEKLQEQAKAILDRRVSRELSPDCFLCRL